jgi:hypothetical protein
MRLNSGADLEESSSKNDNRSRAVTSNNILALTELHEHLCSGMAGLQMLHDSSAVVSDEHLRRVEMEEAQMPDCKSSTSPSGICIILSIPRGPRDVRTNSAIALAFAIFARRMSVARELMFFESCVSFFPTPTAAPAEEAEATADAM